MADNYRLPAMPSGDPGTGPLIRAIDNGTSLEQVVRIGGGANLANETGSLTAAQPLPGTVVAGGTSTGTADYSSMGNVTIAVFGAAHAGFTVVFEGSPDGGTNWFSLSAQDEVTNVGVRDVPIATNSARVFSLSLFGFNRFRIRASTRTSGTLSFVIAPGTLIIEPVVSAVASNPAGSQMISLTPANAGVATATTTEALATLIPTRNFVAAATSTTHVVTAGKTLRVLGFSAGFRGAAATATIAIITLRVNPAGAVAATSPIVAQIFLSVPATANSHVVGSASFGQFIEIPSGAGFGISTVLTTANAASVSWPTLNGIEY
jgi:hypothetical protein